MKKLKQATQLEKARRALKMKQAAEAETQAEIPESRTPNDGMQPNPNEKTAPSGALDHAGQHPAMQRAKFARQ